MDCDEEGFWYPAPDYNKCNRCGLCVRVCPIINKINVNNKPSYEPSAYACINNDEATRLYSSSGGIFTLIAEQIINQDGVVFGAGFTDNFEVLHKYVETIDGLEELRGSKYVQSKVENTYKQVKTFLSQGRKVLFSGTPCQISGLKSYLNQSYDNLLCIDIVCYGVPSPKVFKKYIVYQEDRFGSQVNKIFFRNKNEGWKRYSVYFKFKNNIEYQQTHDKDLYMRVFLKDVCLRPSCYSCKFKSLNRESDITLADFWGIHNLLPEMDDDKGTSLVLVNSNAGKEILDTILDKINFIKVDLSEAIKYNPAAIMSPQWNKNRNYFFADLNNLKFDKLVNKYCKNKLEIRIIKIVKPILIKTGLFNYAKWIVGKVNHKYN